MSTTTTDLSSIGFVCQTLQQPPGKIRFAAESLGLRPALCINGVAHYDDEQVAAIRERLAATNRKTTGGVCFSPVARALDRP